MMAHEAPGSEKRHTIHPRLHSTLGDVSGAYGRIAPVHTDIHDRGHCNVLLVALLRDNSPDLAGAQDAVTPVYP